MEPEIRDSEEVRQPVSGPDRQNTGVPEAPAAQGAAEGEAAPRRRRRSERYAEPEEAAPETRKSGISSGSRTAQEVANRYRQRERMDWPADRAEGAGRSAPARESRFPGRGEPLDGTTRMPTQRGDGRRPAPGMPREAGYASAGREDGIRKPREQVGYEPGRMGMTPAQRARMSAAGRERLALESRMSERDLQAEARNRAREWDEENDDPVRKEKGGRGGKTGRRPRKAWLIPVLALLILAALGAAVMLTPEDAPGPLGSLHRSVSGLLGGKKAASACVLRFEVESQDQETVPANLIFGIRTTKDAVDLRVTDREDHVLPVTRALSGEGPLEWKLTWHTEEPYEGEIRLETLTSAGWTVAEETVMVRILPAEGEDGTPAAENGEAAEPEGFGAEETSGAEFFEEAPEQEGPGGETEGESLNGDPEAEAPEADGEQPEIPEEQWEIPEEAPEAEIPEGEESAEPAGEDAEAAEEEPEGWPEWDSEADPDMSPEEGESPEETLEPEVPEEQPEEVPVLTPVETAEPEIAGNGGKEAPADAEPTEEPRKTLTVKAAESADPSLISTTVIYNGTKKVVEYARADKEKIHMPVLGEYTRQKTGVLTFRNDAFRQNAAVGTVKGLNSLTLSWTADAGSAKGANQTYYGIGWVGQPAIVKWSKEVREQSDLYESKKEKSGLKEVIVAGQDGRIYFLDLSDGTATRNSIKVGFPMRGTPSVHPGGAPYINVGQFARKMASRQGNIGLRQFNLYMMKELSLIDGLDQKNNRPYNKIGSFETSALIDRTTDAKVMVTAGTNGMLYLINLNSDFDYNAGTYSQSPTTVVMKSKAKGEKDAETAVEASVAMYDRYVYYADMGGYLRCVDTNTLTVAWAVALGDAVESTPALDWHGEDGLDLYAATILSSRKKGNAEVKCFDALSGEARWTAEFGVRKDTKNKTVSGFRASPVVGQNGLSEYVYYTVNNLSEEGQAQLDLGDETAALIALRKADGSVAWVRGLTGRAYSSPVAVYDGDGNGAVIQCAGDGSIVMLDGRTGAELATLEIDGAIEASPAVYDGMLVVGTSERNKNNIYGIRIE